MIPKDKLPSDLDILDSFEYTCVKCESGHTVEHNGFNGKEIIWNVYPHDEQG